MPGTNLEEANTALTENQIGNLEVNLATLISLTNLAVVKLDTSEIKNSMIKIAKSSLFASTSQSLKNLLEPSSTLAEKKTIDNHLTNEAAKAAISGLLTNTGHNTDDVKSLLAQQITQQDLTEAGINIPQAGQQLG